MTTRKSRNGRLLRSQVAEEKAAAVVGGAAAEEKILNNFFTEHRLGSTKWKERKGALRLRGLWITIILILSAVIAKASKTTDNSCGKSAPATKPGSLPKNASTKLVAPPFKEEWKGEKEMSSLLN
ncbi:3704_t:CDS:2 [Funneliformis mosseae]|uniref:3704_t:CDS:1 n=1 Tax=Funneliformis mosseae TaxID=27381 RepID=A0A9N8W4H7_FUNMO|nr:3704_t:CDS:2 [Funneliformis mosseae]